MSKKLLLLLTLLVVIVYISTLILPLLKTEETRVVKIETYSNTVNVKGIAVRNEEIINTKRTDNTIFTVENGTKVANNNVMARKYSDVLDIDKLNRISEIEKEITILNDINTHSIKIGSQTQISKNIYENIYKFNRNIKKSNTLNIENNRHEILKSVVEREKIINKNIDIGVTIQNLESEKTAISNSLNGQYKDITVNNSGYFVNHIDNFEDKINTQNYETLTPQQIVDLINTNESKKDYTRLGKIIKDYKWRYIMLIDKEYVKDVKIGASLNLLFDGDERNAIPANVFKMVDYNGKVLIYLESEYLNEYIVDIRISYAQVIIKKYTGIKIEQSALRIKNGEKGVYIKTKTGKVFKKTDSIFSDDEYIISKEMSNDSKYVQLYDEVIIN